VVAASNPCEADDKPTCAFPTGMPQIPDDCEIMLDIEHKTGDEVDWHAATQCLKRPGTPLVGVAPGAVFIEGPNNYHLGKIPLHGIKVEKSDHQCVWNGIFRDGAPPTFILTTKQGGSLGDYLSLVRVFRNGELAYSWRPGNVPATTLTIPGDSLRGYLEPFDAPIDLRFLPAGVAIPETTLSQQVATSQAPWVGRFETALKAVADDPGLASIAADLGCVKWLSQKAVSVAQTLSGTANPPAVGPPPDGCTAPDDGLTADYYQKVRKQIVGEAQSVNGDVDAMIKKVGDTYGQLIGQAAATAKKKLMADVKAKPLPNGLSVSVSLQTVDELVVASTGAFDQAAQTIDKARTQVLAIAADRERQAQDFAHVAATLEAKGSLFQEEQQNPQLATSEVMLPMQYGDPFQWYFLAPWNAVTYRVGGNRGPNTPGLENAIPVIDVVGTRYNFGRGWRYIRLGLGVAYIKDEVQTTTPTGQTQTSDDLHFTTEANINVGGYSVGAGLVAFDSDQFPRFRDRWRLFVGVDLVRLITGAPTETF
jgi:hypothetical protein